MMNREEIIKFLKENLTIVLRHNSQNVSYGYTTAQSIEVKLMINDEEISSDEIGLD